MPYSVGAKGSNGCSGYPVVKEGGEVMGCHATEQEATAQLQALYANEAEKADGGILPTQTNQTANSTGVGIKRPEQGRSGKRIKLRKPKLQGGNGENASGAISTSGTSMTAMYKAETIVEGDYVMGMTTEGAVVGLVEHVMTEGGVYGIPGTEYSIQSTPENPAMAVRIFEYEEDEDQWCPTAYSIGMLMSDAKKIEELDVEVQESEEDDIDELERMAKASPCWDGYTQRGMKPGEGGKMVPNCVPVQKYYEALEKADTYTPTAGMKSAAARAIRWKQEGKANGAGTPVGWGRARDIVAGRSMSLSVVKRMYSFFSRHEVDKKGKDFNNTSNPSNGRIMWDAWGGDAGYSWSRAIVEREKNNKFWSDTPFGK